MLDEGGLLAEGVLGAGTDGVAHLDGDGGIPQLLLIQGGDVDAPGDEGAGLLLNDVQGTGDAVEDIAQQAGAQLDGHGRAGGGDGLTGGQTGGVLVDLHGGHAAAHAYDLANQTLITHVHHIHHGQTLAADDGDNRAVDALDNILAHSIILTTNR